MILKESLPQFAGFEFARFKLKPGKTEADLLKAAKALEIQFLVHQPELFGHFILKGEGGWYADVVLASTQAKAEEYCQQWLKSEVALAFLDHLEEGSTDMTFWSRIH